MDHSCEHPASPHQHRKGNAIHDGDLNSNRPESFLLDNIIVGYAFGPKKMETMGLIMAEASKALSTFECAGTLSSMINKHQWGQHTQPQQKNKKHLSGVSIEMFDESSAGDPMALISVATGDSSEDNAEKESSGTASRNNRYFSDNDEEDTRSMSSTYTRSSFISQRSSSQQRGSGGGGNTVNGIQLTFLPDSSGFIHLVRKATSSGGGCGGAAVGGEGESITGSSITTSATSFPSIRKQGVALASCSSLPLSLSSSPIKESNEPSPNSHLGQSSHFPHQGLGTAVVKQSQFCSNGSACSGNSRNLQRHPIRVSFVPIDLDTPLEEQHGGKFDVILHKMTEDILCMSKMLRARSQSSRDFDEGCKNDDNFDTVQITGGMQPPPMVAQTTIVNSAIEDPNLFESTPSMTRHQARASQRIQRLREYKQKVHPSCVLVDSPNNILAVMSRADMAEALSRCLAGVTTKGGISVRTPRFRVVDEDSMLLEARNCSDESTSMLQRNPTLADEIDDSGFEYPLIAKPLTAAGTKSSHHMGIVLARDGLQRLKTPCLLQEYANHGQTLFKVYVLGESVWVFSRESLPNLPMGEKHIIGSAAPDAVRCPVQPNKRPRTESYVEFERLAGSRCYVEFNSQRPYPKLSDFGIDSGSEHMDGKSVCQTKQDDIMSQQCDTERSKIQRLESDYMVESYHDKELKQSSSAKLGNINSQSTAHRNPDQDLAKYVTMDEIEPVTAALRDAFGLELFGFDLLVKYNDQNSSQTAGSNIGVNGKEILVVDVNYFPGYKEVPNFPSLLAQYLTQKAVESRVRNFDGS